MASNKKINIPIYSLSYDEIYALLDSIESGKEEDIENSMNDSDTEFVDRSVVENKDSDMHLDEKPETTSNDAHSNLIPTHLPIQPVRQDVPEEESSNDEPLITLAKQKEPVWKWRKCFAKTPLQPCSLKEEGVVNMQTENVTPFEGFSKCTGLPGLILAMMKIESERYAAQNGRQFRISEEEFCTFLGANLLMGINKLPTMKSYWSVDEGLRNSLIRKAMTRARFLEILQNIHADNHKELPPKESEEYDRAWKLRPLFDHLGKHFQDMLQPEGKPIHEK